MSKLKNMSTSLSVWKSENSLQEMVGGVPHLISFHLTKITVLCCPMCNVRNHNYIYFVVVLSGQVNPVPATLSCPKAEVIASCITAGKFPEQGLCLRVQRRRIKDVQTHSV